MIICPQRALFGGLDRPLRINEYTEYGIDAGALKM